MPPCSPDLNPIEQALARSKRWGAKPEALGEPPILPENDMERVIEQMRRMSDGLASNEESKGGNAHRAVGYPAKRGSKGTGQ